MKITGWTEPQIDAADATTCDWFLALDAVERGLANRTNQQLLAALKGGR